MTVVHSAGPPLATTATFEIELPKKREKNSAA
jgi:hypothetical protein